MLPLNANELTPSQLWVCAEGKVTKYMGDVTSYKVCVMLIQRTAVDHAATGTDSGQYTSQDPPVIIVIFGSRCAMSCPR